MVNYMLPQQAVNHVDQQMKDFTDALIDGYFAHAISNMKAFDKMTGSVFNTYSSKIVDSLKEVNTNAKQFARTGKVTCPYCTGNKG